MDNHQQQPSDFDQQVGRNIQELRKARGLTQGQLADRLTDRGMRATQQMIVKVEKGQRPLRFNEAGIIADALEVLVSDLSLEEFVLDNVAILVSRTRDVYAAWSDLSEAAKHLAGCVDNLRFTLGRVRENGQMRDIPQHLLNEAYTMTFADAAAIAAGAIKQRDASARAQDADAEAAVDMRVFDEKAEL